MERDINEVLASQRKMLQRQGRSGGNLSDAQLGKIFKRQICEVRQMLTQRSIPMLNVAYSDALQHSMEIAKKIQAFFGEDLDVYAMAAAVDPNLYRQRYKQ